MCSFLDSLVKMTNGQNEVKMMFSDVLYSRKEQVDERVPKTERPKVERPFLPRGEGGSFLSPQKLAIMATGESRIRPRWRLGLATAAVVCCHASSASLQDGAGVAVATERSSSNYPLKRSSRTSRPSAQTRPSNGGRRGVGVLDARGGGAGDPDVRAGRAAAAAAGGGKKKTPLNVLKELMASMEESDYGSYGMWGDLKEDVATGPTSMGTSTSRGSSGSAAETGSLAVDDPATASSSPPAAVAADLSGRWANEDLVARDVAAAMAANPAFGGRRARAAAKAAAQVDGDELNQDQQQFEHDASNNRRALAPGATNAPRSQWATVAVPPDAAEDLTLEEPPVGTEGAEDFVKKALRTAYRLAAVMMVYSSLFCSS